MPSGLHAAARARDTGNVGEEKAPAVLAEPSIAHELVAARDVTQRPLELSPVDPLSHPELMLNLLRTALEVEP